MQGHTVIFKIWYAFIHSQKQPRDSRHVCDISLVRAVAMWHLFMTLHENWGSVAMGLIHYCPDIGFMHATWQYKAEPDTIVMRQLTSKYLVKFELAVVLQEAKPFDLFPT